MDICYGSATSYRDALLALSHTLYPILNKKYAQTFPNITGFAKLEAEWLNSKERFSLYKNGYLTRKYVSMTQFPEKMTK